MLDRSYKDILERKKNPKHIKPNWSNFAHTLTSRSVELRTEELRKVDWSKSFPYIP